MALDRDFQEREQSRARAAAAEERYLAERIGATDRAERIRAWRSWAARKLETTFNHWPSDIAARQHAIGLCVAELEVIARHLYERAWLFDGAKLAAIATAALAPIAAAQRAGKIEAFFPYFRASVRRHVGLNAEELQHAARTSGSDGASAIGDILANVIGRIRPPSIVEDLATTHAARVQAPCKGSARGRPRKFAAAEAATPGLFD